MSTKILNLDDFSKDTRTLTIKGKSYNVEGMTVENFIETTKAAERLEQSTSMSEQFEASVEMIQRAVPSLPIEVLRSLKLEQLAVVSAFVRGEDPEAVAEAGEGTDGKK